MKSITLVWKIKHLNDDAFGTAVIWRLWFNQITLPCYETNTNCTLFILTCVHREGHHLLSPSCAPGAQTSSRWDDLHQGWPNFFRWRPDQKIKKTQKPKNVFTFVSVGLKNMQSNRTPSYLSSSHDHFLNHTIFWECLLQHEARAYKHFINVLFLV